MLKTALQYLINLGNVETVTEGHKVFSTQPLHRINKLNNVDALTLRSLSGLVDYIKSNFDIDHSVMVHVESPTKVSVFDALDLDHSRQTYVVAKAMLPQIQFERFLESEKFNIMLQSCFVPNAHRELVLKVIGSIVEDATVQTKDDGVTQSVTAKTGVATVGNEKVPNPVLLKPFRTFVEVPQPESEFVLRVRKGPEAALFEADGAAWELNAMQNIKDYLQAELAELITTKRVVIVA
jgi:hypothetical protein